MNQKKAVFLIEQAGQGHLPNLTDEQLQLTPEEIEFFKGFLERHKSGAVLIPGSDIPKALLIKSK